MTDSTISIDDIAYVARLAKIAVSEEETARLRDELAAILGYVRQLDSVDTADVEPTYQVTGLVNIDRSDDVIDYGVTSQVLLLNTPSSQDNQIKVPKVL